MAERRYRSEQLESEFRHQVESRGLITPEQLQDVTTRLLLAGGTLEQLLVDDELVPEQTVLELLAELSGIRFVHLADLHVDQQVARAIQSRVAHRYKIIPVFADDREITFATASVPDAATVDGLRMLLEKEIDWVLCTRADVLKTLTYFYGLGADTLDTLIAQSENEETIETLGDALDLGDPKAVGVVRFINQIIAEAVRMEATDIHIEPFEDALRLRYRIDGILQEIPLPEGVGKLNRSVSSAVKIMAAMDIAERRKPHDGRIKVKLGGREFDLRVSVLPSGFGETVNMRILSRNSSFVDLTNLGLSEKQLPQVLEMCSLPHGVILLTGPTGSGKTTTLYALLAKVNSAAVKTITVEDPIEYQMNGISQIQTHARIGLTFASILRSILRHDPDVILIGEIRDSETADIAVRASLTGHLVFSTLHTNDAPSAITRLSDMSIEPYLISSCLEGVIAQRLVRRVCQSCKREEQPSDALVEEIAQYYPDRAADARFLVGEGCPDCSFTGYHGRSAIIETMVMTDALREMVVQRKHSNEIKQAAIRNGMTTLRADGWLKVLDGATSVDEVLRVARRSEVE